MPWLLYFWSLISQLVAFFLHRIVSTEIFGSANKHDKCIGAVALTQWDKEGYGRATTPHGKTGRNLPKRECQNAGQWDLVTVSPSGPPLLRPIDEREERNAILFRYVCRTCHSSFVSCHQSDRPRQGSTTEHKSFDFELFCTLLTWQWELPRIVWLIHF